MLKTLLIAAFLNGLVWILLIPVWQYPDEQSHFAQVQSIAEKSQRVGDFLNTSYEIALSEEIMGTSRDNSGNNKFTYHPEYKIDYSHTTIGLRENELISRSKSSKVELVKNEATSNPPLYYISSSYFYKLFYNASLFTRVIAIRIFSLLIFMCTIFISIKIGTLVFQKSKILPLSLSSLIAFKPMLVYTSTGILPDTLTNFLFSTIIFYSFKILYEEFKKKDLLILIIFLFAGFMTRQQFYISLLIILLPVLFLISKRTQLIKPFILFTIIAAVSIYIVNIYLTSVPLITNFRIPDTSIFSNNRISFTSFIKFVLWSLRQTYAEAMPWFWGIYKWLSLSLPANYYKIINRIVFIAVIGFLLKMFFVVKEKNYKQLKILTFLIWIPSIYFITLMVWNYFFFTKNGFSFGIQGRYYFPVIVPIITVLLLGLNYIGKIILKSFSKYLLILLVCLMIVFNTTTLIHISASYYDISSLKTFIIQASQYKPILFKGNIIILFILLALFFQVLYIIKFLKFTIRTNETF